MKDSGNIEEFDQLVKGLMEGAQSPVPPGVWEGVSTGVSGGAAPVASGIFKSVISKWVAAIVGGLVLTTSIIILSTDKNSIEEPAATEHTEIAEVDQSKLTSIVEESENEGLASVNTSKSERIEVASKTSKTSNSGSREKSGDDIRVEPAPEKGNQIVNGEKPTIQKGIESIILELSNENPCAGEAVEITLLGDNVSSSSVQWWVDSKFVAVAKIQKSFLFDEAGSKTIEARFVHNGEKKFLSKTLEVKRSHIDLYSEIEKGVMRLKTNDDLSNIQWFVNSVELDQSSPIVEQSCKNGSTSKVVLIARRSNSCADTVRRNISCQWDEDISIEIPNFFSPYVVDGQNDEFEIIIDQVEYYQLQIRDSKGRLVYETTDQASFWNGRINNSGELLPEGWYSYVLVYGPELEKRNKIGRVLLGR